MIKKHMLLKSQKNQVFKILQEEGLEPANFSWVETTSVWGADIIISSLNYRGGHFYFKFDFFFSKRVDDFIPKTPHCEFSPGGELPMSHEYPDNWQLQKDCVHKWAGYLKREIEAPDLWAEMEKYKTSVSLALPEQLLNEPIPASEAEKISEQLSSLADKIEKQFELTNEQNQFVRSKLNYLADAAKRQRSMDWANTLIGVSVTIAMGLALAPDKAKELWELMRRLGELIHLFGP